MLRKHRELLKQACHFFDAEVEGKLLEIHRNVGEGEDGGVGLGA